MGPSYAVLVAATLCVHADQAASALLRGTSRHGFVELLLVEPVTDRRLVVDAKLMRALIAEYDANGDRGGLQRHESAGEVRGLVLASVINNWPVCSN